MITLWRPTVAEAGFHTTWVNALTNTPRHDGKPHGEAEQLSQAYLPRAVLALRPSVDHDRISRIPPAPWPSRYTGQPGRRGQRPTPGRRPSLSRLAAIANTTPKAQPSSTASIRDRQAPPEPAAKPPTRSSCRPGPGTGYSCVTSANHPLARRPRPATRLNEKVQIRGTRPPCRSTSATTTAPRRCRRSSAGSIASGRRWSNAAEQDRDE